MTTQEAYEQIRAYFSREGAQLAWDDDLDSCQYCTEDGRRCAVGCLIPAGLYDQNFEGTNIRSLIDAEHDRKYRDAGTAPNTRAALVDLFAGVDPVFLEKAQERHDGLAEEDVLATGDFVNRLDLLAEEFHLTVPS